MNEYGFTLCQRDVFVKHWKGHCDFFFCQQIAILSGHLSCPNKWKTRLSDFLKVVRTNIILNYFSSLIYFSLFTNCYLVRMNYQPTCSNKLKVVRTNKQFVKNMKWKFVCTTFQINLLKTETAPYGSPQVRKPTGTEAHKGQAFSVNSMCLQNISVSSQIFSASS